MPGNGRDPNRRMAFDGSLSQGATGIRPLVEHPYRQMNLRATPVSSYRECSPRPEGVDVVDWPRSYSSLRMALVALRSLASISRSVDIMEESPKASAGVPIVAGCDGEFSTRIGT
jgi:hypothetical protein